VNPETEQAFEQFLERALQSGLIDELRSSTVVMATDADDADLQMALALEVGAALVYDKPLMLVVHAGHKIPQKVRDAADEIVELEEGGFKHPANQGKLMSAMLRMSEKQPGPVSCFRLSQGRLKSDD
jgi:ATP:corrinoid adenosyltransferase